MNAFAGVVAFALIWACVFLASLPWGVARPSPEDTDGAVEGAEAGAPLRPAIARKAVISFAVTTALFVIFAVGVVLGWFNPETWPTWALYPSSRDG